MPPYTESYTLSIQRQIAASTFLSVSYVGTQAHHLLVLTSANPGNPALCLSLSQPNEVMPGTPTCGPFGESGIYTTPTGQRHSGDARTVQFPVRRRHLPEDHREFRLQRSRDQSSPQLRAPGVHGWLHLQQIYRSVFQPGGGSQPAESRAEQGALRFRHAPQLRGELQIPAAGQQSSSTARAAGPKGGPSPA